MSYLFAFDEPELQDNIARDNAAHPFDFSTLHPGFFDGFGSELYDAPVRGLIKGQQGLAYAGAALASRPLAALSDEDPTELAKGSFNDIDQIYGAALKPFQTSPDDIGTAGKIVGGALEGISEFVGGVGLGFATEKAVGLSKQGVPANTAALAGALQAGGLTLGAGAGAIGESLASRLAYSTITNVAAGYGTSYAQQKLLEVAGRPDLAEQFRVHPQDLAVDALLGLAFGAGHHISAEFSEAKFRDAVQTLAQDAHLRKAPLAPADLHSENLDVNAKQQAAEDLILGKPVDVAPETAGATFEPDPNQEARERDTENALADFAKDNGVEPQPEETEPESVESTKPEATLSPGSEKPAGINSVVEQVPQTSAPHPLLELPETGPEFHYTFDDGQTLPVSEANNRIEREATEADETATVASAVGDCYLGALS